MSQAKLSQLWGGGVMGKMMALLICFNVAILGFELAWSTATSLVSGVLMNIFWSAYCFYVVSVVQMGAGTS